MSDQAQIEHWPISRLLEYARNPRKNDHAVDRVASAIREFGFKVPVVARSDGTVVDGHLRLKAARKLGLETVPVLLADDLTEAQVKAFRISVNRMAELADWDLELLRLEFDELEAMGVDLDITGFGKDDLASLFPSEPGEGLTDPDEAPEATDDLVTVLGDVWLLGQHRIACGDCTDPVVVDKALNGARPHLMVTDPPYGVEYDADWRTTARNADGSLLSTGTGRAKGAVANDNRADWREAWALFPGDVAYVWHAGNMAHIVAESLIACELHMRSQIIWAKSQLVIGRGNYHPQHEPCWYAVRKGSSAKFTDDRTQTTLWKNIDDVIRRGELVFVARDQAKKVYGIRGDHSTLWQIPKPMKSETGHSTQKPVECMARPIRNHDSEFVYEPFSGSGTTIIACEQLQRKCRAIELNPAYVDVAVKRWQDFTGQQAILEADGRTFAEVSEAREAA